MKYQKLLLVLLLVLAPVMAAAVTYSALTVREMGNFLRTLPTDFHSIPIPAARAQIDAVNPFILDVREPAELRDGIIAGSVNIPIRDVPAQMAKLPKDRPILVVCAVGHRGALVVAFMRGQGYNIRSISTGMRGWIAANQPIVRP